MNIYNYVKYFKNKPSKSGKLSLWRELRVMSEKLSECFEFVNHSISSEFTSYEISTSNVTVGSVASSTAMRLNDNIAFNRTEDGKIPRYISINLTGNRSIVLPIYAYDNTIQHRFKIFTDTSWHICDGSQQLASVYVLFY